MIPVRNINAAMLIDVASVCRAEKCRCDIVRLELVVGPLTLFRIVPKKSNGHIIPVENGHAPFQLGDDSKVSVKTHLAWPTQMLC